MPPIRILHLEDNAGDARLIADRLDAGGIDAEIDCVDTQKQFETALSSARYDCILSDYNIPGFDGLAALKMAIEVSPLTPVLMVSGEIEASKAVECLRSGATDFLLKDRLEVLIPALRRTLAEAARKEEVKSTLAKLQESEERFRQLAESIGDVFWVTNPGKSKMQYISPAYEHIWGRPSLSLYAAPNAWLEAVHPEDRERVRRATLTQAAGNYLEEYRIIRPDGELRWIRDRAFPVKNEAGEVYRIVGIAQDITERRLARERERLLEIQFHQAQKMESIGKLAGGVAHDFNNILTAIMGYTNFLADGPTRNGTWREDVEEIRKAAERAAGLTRQLLAFSRRQTLQPKVLDLNTEFTEMKNMLRRMVGEDIDWSVSLASGLGCIKADQGQIQQVLMNLIVNARDAMPSGGKLTVSTKNIQFQEPHAENNFIIPPGAYVVIAVSDTGGGIDENIKAHIFEPFFTTKEKGKGTGLGLAVIYGIITQCDGYIVIDSAPNKGTTFKIFFPTTEGVVGAKNGEQSVQEPCRGTETILLVDDDEAVRTLLRRVLRQHGYALLEAARADEALKLARAHKGKLHLLLTDMVLPDINGMELARQISSIRPETGIMLISGYLDRDVGNFIIDENTPFLHKPFATTALVRMVRKVLDTSAKPT